MRMKIKNHLFPWIDIRSLGTEINAPHFGINWI